MGFEWLLLPGISLLLLAGMLALQEWGRRSAPPPPPGEGGEEGTGPIVAAVFALLGLLLAFQFSNAAARLDARRSLLVQEANAIGTAYLRVDLLPAADQPPLRELFRRYLDARIAVYQAIPDLETANRHRLEAVRLQGEIWSRTVRACEEKPTPGVNVLVLPALNDLIDITTTRDAATLTHGSLFIGGFLIAVCLLAALLAGRAMARASRRPLFHIVIFAALISATVYINLDLEYPRIGLIRTGVVDQALVALRESMR